MEIYEGVPNLPNVYVMFEDVIVNNNDYQINKDGVPVAVVMSWDTYSDLVAQLSETK